MILADNNRNTLAKRERINSLKQLEVLFDRSGSLSLSSFPLRVVYRVVARGENEPLVQMLISVPKKHLHRAVKRNKVKRQVRAAYRVNKHGLISYFETVNNRSAATGKDGNADSEMKREGVDLAFIWLSDDLYESSVVERRVVNLLDRLQERLAKSTN
jgi:ribonuclease P protein component